MIGRPVWRFTEVASTQDIAFRLAELGAPHGTIVRADYQTAGRGRQGRKWDAPAGLSLMFSVLLRPTCPLHELGSMSLAVGSVLADVFASHTTAPVQIKWPNDVLIDGRKVSGILMQTRTGASSIAVLGIGINVSTPDLLLPVGATSLQAYADDPVDTDVLFSELIIALDRMDRDWQPLLRPDEVSQIEARLWQNGELVSLLDAEREIVGRIIGLDSSGGLRLESNGTERIIVSGEIVRGPRPIG